MQQGRELIELDIESLAGTGEGVGRHSGLAVFVPYTVPGDKILADVGPAGQGRRRGRSVRIIEAGPHRVDPPCGLFGFCGGCAWLCCSYESQVDAKANHARRAFRIAGGAAQLFGEVPITVEKAGALYGYRRKARLHWEKTPKGVVIGFKDRRGRRIVDLGDGGVCVVLRPEIRSAVGLLREILVLNGAPSAGEVSVLAGARNRVHLAFFPGAKRGAGRGGRCFTGAAKKKCEEIVVSGRAAGMVFRERNVFSHLGADGVFLEEGPEMTMKGSAACFAQANAEMNERIRKTVRGMEVTGSVLELYAGIGNFTVEFLSCESITAAEIDEAACDLLTRNAAFVRGGSRIRVWNKDASAAVTALLSRVERGLEVVPSLVVLDPPRSGCAKLINSLLSLRSSKILYISCDAMTCARDVAGLIQDDYEIAQIIGFDTMPHTSHFELVVLLRKRNAVDEPA